MKIPMLLIVALATALNVIEPQVQPTGPLGWKEAIDSNMAFQEDAWNRGDLEAFMQPYIFSDSLLFVGSRGISYGWQTTLDNYRKGFPDKAAIGRLEFDNQVYKSLQDEYALVIGRFHVYREKDTLSGSYSLIWQLIDGEWKIIADHSS